ncbi:MAG TPA: DUF5615 family PIN-like protein [Anaerolineae bacterium]
MPVALYMDVHVPQAVAEQLLRRNVDVFTAIEDKATELTDEELLDHCAGLDRLLVTFDIRFKAMAEDWQRNGRPFGGLVYAHPLRVSIGQLVHDLELIAKATERSEWLDVIEHLPL